MKKTKSPTPPYKQQDGYHYLRMQTAGKENGNQVYSAVSYDHGDFLEIDFLVYDDSAYGQRIISSRRVERAVEMDDYLQLCERENLRQGFFGGKFYVENSDGSISAKGTTLREAYHRYHHYLNNRHALS